MANSNKQLDLVRTAFLTFLFMSMWVATQSPFLWCISVQVIQSVLQLMSIASYI